MTQAILVSNRGIHYVLTLISLIHPHSSTEVVFMTETQGDVEVEDEWRGGGCGGWLRSDCIYQITLESLSLYSNDGCHSLTLCPEQQISVSKLHRLLDLVLVRQFWFVFHIRSSHNTVYVCNKLCTLLVTDSARVISVGTNFLPLGNPLLTTQRALLVRIVLDTSSSTYTSPYYSMDYL